jgi:hypothetical protein
MICCNTCLSHEQTTTSREFLIAIDPDVEILMRLVSRKRDMHTLNNALASMLRKEVCYGGRAVARLLPTKPRAPAPRL